MRWDYIKSQFQKYYKNRFDEDLLDFDLDKNKPVISQIVEFLKQKRKYSSWDMDAFKKQVSDDFKPSKSALDKKFILLKSIAEKIIENLNQ